MSTHPNIQTPLPPEAIAAPPPVPGPALEQAQGSAEFQQLLEKPFSAFGSIGQFKDAQRMAIMLAQSSIVPENYRGEKHLGDCVIALEIANRIGASVLAVMQNLYLVQGRPGWSAQFLISCVNATRRFSPIRYKMTGTRGEDSWGCIAWATDKTGQELKSPEVTIKMAKEEGWFYRNDSKWRTMPEIMLCYRSATFFIRLYAPEMTMGMQTAEEVAEIAQNGNGHSNRPIFNNRHSKAGLELQCCKLDPIALEQPAALADQKPNGISALESASERCQVAAAAPTIATKPSDFRYNYLKALTGLIELSEHCEADLLRFLYNSRRCDEAFASLAEVAEKQPECIVWAHDSWKSVDRELSRLKTGRAV